MKKIEVGPLKTMNKDEEGMNFIWEQIADYFNLRIRLMFINKEKPWNWKTEFAY